MPVGVQLVARRYNDTMLLDAAHWLIARAGVAATMA
jgi:Asp-tRNA(Asn)/Glu-tRNA(Gln) amidotransferase A subunit family amidase